MKYIASIAAIASVNADKIKTPRCDFDFSRELGHASNSLQTSTNTLVNGIRTITNPEYGWNTQWFGLKPDVDVNDIRCDFKVISMHDDYSWV